MMLAISRSIGPVKIDILIRRPDSPPIIFMHYLCLSRLAKMMVKEIGNCHVDLSDQVYWSPCARATSLHVIVDCALYYRCCSPHAYSAGCEEMT